LAHISCRDLDPRDVEKNGSLEGSGSSDELLQH
jgi:hypothetical protein